MLSRLLVVVLVVVLVSVVVVNCNDTTTTSTTTSTTTTASNTPSTNTIDTLSALSSALALSLSSITTASSSSSSSSSSKISPSVEVTVSVNTTSTISSTSNDDTTRRSLQVLNKPKVGVFSPFGIATGSGECYLLSAISAFRSLGYDVDLITFEDAQCLENACIEQNLRELRLPLHVEDFGLHLISDDSDAYNDADVIYDIFITMGIKKLPQIPMIAPSGRYLNIYFCLFPFDWARGGKDFDKKLDLWAAYDYVLVNSKYTHDWYARATIPWIHRGLKRNIYVPTLVLVNHPVLPFKAAGKFDPGSEGPGSDVVIQMRQDIDSHLSKLQDDIVNIAIRGPFTSGDYTTAHAAIRLFSKLLRDPNAAKTNVHLFIIGKVLPSANVEQFTANLRGNMTDRLTSKVSLMFDASNDEITNTLSSCLIVWDLNFLNFQIPRFPEPLGDPFPITILESMFSGCIPVAINLASLPEIIIPNFNGFLGHYDDDIVERSIHIIKMSDVERTRLRLNSIKTAHSFGLESFQKCLNSFINDGLKHRDLTVLTRTRLKDTWNIPLSTEPLSIGYVAVLLAPSMHGTLELEIRNVMSYIGQGWALQVHHTKDNVALCKQVLAGIANIQYVELKLPIHTDDDYNRLMKSESFWGQFKENEKVLIFTLDSYMLRLGIKDFMKYDYVAPPLPIAMLAKYHLNSDGTPLVGNNTIAGLNAEHKKKKKNLRYDISSSKRIKSGEESEQRRQLVNAYVNTHHYKINSKDESRPTAASFSLRSVKSMLSIIRDYGQSSSDSEPEAIFFLRSAVKMNMNIAPRAMAYNFAVQYDCSDLSLIKDPPLAIHHAWKYYNYEKVSSWIKQYVIKSENSNTNTNTNANSISNNIDTAVIVSEPRPVLGNVGTEIIRDSIPAPATSISTSSSNSNSGVSKSSSTSTSTDSNAVDINKAWEILNTSNYIKDPKGLKSLTEKTGISEPDDLKLLNKDTLNEFANLFKSIPRVKFMNALGIKQRGDESNVMDTPSNTSYV